MRAMANAILHGITGLAGAIGVWCLGGCSGGQATPALPASHNDAGVANVTPGAFRGPAGLGYGKGNEAATVVVTEFSDFGCHYCADFARTVLPTVEREFIATGRVRWQLVPPATVSTPHALAAAGAAVCAAQQGDVWGMHDSPVARQRTRRPRTSSAWYADSLM